MTGPEERKVRITGVGYSSITIGSMALFWLFWMQSGWYRIDCALGTSKACDLIAAEYAEKPKP